MASRLLYLVVWLTISRLCVRSNAYEFSNHLNNKDKSDFLREGFDSYILSNTLHFIYDDRFQRSVYGLPNTTIELKCYVSAPKRSPLNGNNVYHDFTLKWLRYKSSFDDTGNFHKHEVFKQSGTETQKLTNLTIDGPPRRLVKEESQSNVYEFVLRVPVEGDVTYRCLIDDEFGKIFSSAMMPLKAVLPGLSNNYVNVTQPKGSNARIECRLNSHVIPKVSIKWFKDEEELEVDGYRIVSLPVSHRGEIDTEHEYVAWLGVYGTLYLYDLREEDEGAYSCAVENPWGFDKKEVATVLIDNNSPNSLIHKPVNLLLFESLLGVLECFTSYDSRITWTFTGKDGIIKPVNKSYIVGRQSIVIPKSDIKNIGNYTCHLESSRGKQSFRAQLSLRYVDSVIYTPPIKRVHGMKGLKCTMPFVTGCVYNAYKQSKYPFARWFVNGTSISDVAEEYQRKYNKKVFAVTTGNKEELLAAIREYKGGKTKLNVTMRHEILEKTIEFVESLPKYARFSVLKISAEFTELSGYYQCLVSSYVNEYSQSSQFHIPETSPDVDNITVVKTMPASILLNITRKKLGGFRSQDEVIVVNVQFTCINSTGKKPDWYSKEDWQACKKDGEEVFDMKPTSKNPNWRTANVTKLLPDTNYSIQIVPYSKRGCGPRTPVNIKTKALRPSAFPNYKLAISSTSLKFRFDRLLGPKCGGRILSYIIKVGNKRKSIKNGKFEGEIKGLSPNTEYKFLIVPKTEAGEAPHSEENFRTIRTLKQLDSPKKLNFPSMRIESVNVTCALFHLGNEHSYVDIFLKHLSSKSGVHYPDANKSYLNITATVFKVTDLVLDSEYEVDIVYYESIMAFKREIYFYSNPTNHQPPPMPFNLDASIVRKSDEKCCIHVSWEESKSWVGSIQQFVLKFAMKNYIEYGIPLQKNRVILKNFTKYDYEISSSCQSCKTVKSERITFQVQAEIDSKRKSDFSLERMIYFNSSTIINPRHETTSISTYTNNDKKKYFWIGISGVSVFLLTILLFVCFKNVRKMMYLRRNRNTERPTTNKANVGTPVNVQIQERQPLFTDIRQVVLNGEVCSESHVEEVIKRRPDLDGFIDTKGISDVTGEFRGRMHQISCSGSVRSGQSVATHSDSGCHESNLTLHSSEKNEDNEGSDTLGHTSSQSSSAETLCNMHSQQHCKCKQIETSCDNYIQRSEIYHPPRPPQQLACKI
ncbi:DgyrCDS1354 [Dimorphilus gyrociliatus]|uniref:DgyrCDS1354 n=1 Tax=Dimorphilus gyrociliatus TaxID=2664684 RepID=A0A7I8V9X7_9ANNE|nr:DgyrCDS1354 [Dimorphilus gyrociliatus]